MALTNDEIELVYEVLEIPNTTDVLVVEGMFGTGSAFQNGAVLTTKTLIDARLAALSQSREDRLRQLLVEWKAVATTGVKLSPLGENEGVDRNPARERSLLRKRIETLIGVFRSDSSGAVPLG